MIDTDLAIPVVTIPGFVLLKIAAFRDRASRPDKWRSDAQDILHCLDRYEDIRASKRRFSLPENLADVDLSLVGALLLGQDLAGMVREPGAREEVVSFCVEAADEFSDFVNVNIRRPDTEQEDARRREIVEFVQAFHRGFRPRPS
jgi:predicted nucleotidyltransferase